MNLNNYNIKIRIQNVRQKHLNERSYSRAVNLTAVLAPIVFCNFCIGIVYQVNFVLCCFCLKKSKLKDIARTHCVKDHSWPCQL